MIIQYVAEDGKIFDDEDNCANYERSLGIKPCIKDMKFFMKDLKECPLDLDIPYDAYETCYFMVFKTQEAAKRYSNLVYDCGYEDCPTEKGVYYYDEGEMQFMNMEEKVNEMKKFIEKYEKLLKIAKGD